MCHKYLDHYSQELREETNCLFKKARAPRANITREEKKALKELKDKERIVLSVDKGMAMVVSDKKEEKRQRHYWHNQNTGPLIKTQQTS